MEDWTALTRILYRGRPGVTELGSKRDSRCGSTEDSSSSMRAAESRFRSVRMGFASESARTGGAVDLESRRPTRKSDLVPSASGPAFAGAEARSTVPTIMTKPTVLVVEDDVPIRRGLVDALKYAGYAVLECDNGREAIEEAIESPVGLVLLDVMLPEMDGFAVLAELRRVRPRFP